MSNWQFESAGIPDSKFIRGDVPMTKEEVRAVTIAKLRLEKDSLVYDIGAGTGSITVEAALQSNRGQIYAIERKKEGVELIEDNIDYFELDNITVIKGQAPSALSDLPAVDRVMIGGSGGQLAEILAAVDNKLKADGRIVINAVTLDTLASAQKELIQLGYQLEVSHIAVTKNKKVGSYQMMQGLNPVYIICGTKE